MQFDPRSVPEQASTLEAPVQQCSTKQPETRAAKKPSSVRAESEKPKRGSPRHENACLSVSTRARAYLASVVRKDD